MAFECEAWKVPEVEREEELLPLESTNLLELPLEADPQLEAEKAVEAWTDASGGQLDPAVWS